MAVIQSCLLFLLWASGAQDWEPPQIVQTIAGELRIDTAKPFGNARASYLYLRKTLIFIASADVRDFPEDDAHEFLNGNHFLGIAASFHELNDVIVLHQRSGGNACDGVYRVLTLKAAGDFTISHPFGNCNSPSISQRAGSIVFSFTALIFPHSKEKRAGEVWIYKDGEVSQLKPPSTSRAKR